MPIYYTKRQRKPIGKFLVIFLLLELLFTAVYLLAKTFIVEPSTENIILYPTLSQPSPTPGKALAASASLGQAVRNSLTETNGSYGIVVKNLKTGENYSQNEHVSYYSASLYKLWIMAETYRQIRDDLLKEDEVLSEEAETLNDKFNISSESAEIKEGKITLPVKDALNKMITISDNYASLLLTLKIRLANVASFLKANGFNESRVGIDGSSPTTTPHDIALFFEKLYNSQIIGREYSEKMLQLLKWQKLNDKIPRYLPDDTLIAHKTGELDEYTHDGGIVYGQNGDYIIVILSKSNDPDLAKIRLSNVSESVYNYFMNP